VVLQPEVVVLPIVNKPPSHCIAGQADQLDGFFPDGSHCNLENKRKRIIPNQESPQYPIE